MQLHTHTQSNTYFTNADLLTLSTRVGGHCVLLSQWQHTSVGVALCVAWNSLLVSLAIIKRTWLPVSLIGQRHFRCWSLVARTLQKLTLYWLYVVGTASIPAQKPCYNNNFHIILITSAFMEYWGRAWADYCAAHWLHVHRRKQFTILQLVQLSSVKSSLSFTPYDVYSSQSTLLVGGRYKPATRMLLPCQSAL